MKKLLLLAVSAAFLFGAKAQGGLTLVKTFNDIEYLLLEDYCMSTPMLSSTEYKSCYNQEGQGESTCEGENKLMLYDADLNLYKTLYLETIMPDATSFETIEDDAMGDKRFMVTQTLFNDDNLLEIIVKGSNFFAIVNENGKVIAKEEIEHPYYTSFYIKKLGGKTYLHVENEYNAYLYLIDKAASNSVDGNAITKMKAFPNPAREYVNIEYDLQGAKSGTITISNLQGKQILSTEVRDSKHILRIPTDKLAAGMYIVTVNAGEKTLSTEKVIVK